MTVLFILYDITGHYNKTMYLYLYLKGLRYEGWQEVVINREWGMVRRDAERDRGRKMRDGRRNGTRHTDHIVLEKKLRESRVCKKNNQRWSISWFAGSNLRFWCTIYSYFVKKSIDSISKMSNRVRLQPENRILFSIIRKPRLHLNNILGKKSGIPATVNIFSVCVFS